jgi:hypothetical protein
MLSIAGLMKKNVVLSNSGLVLNYSAKTSILDFTITGHMISLPIDLHRLEVVNLINSTILDAKNGYITQAAWENPNVKLDGKMSKAESIALGYYIMLSFIDSGTCGTRDIWLVFRGVHHSLLSYVRNRAISNQLLLRYKVALLSCHFAGYGINDIHKIERTFARCGLSKQNYIFYLMMILDQTCENIVMDHNDKFILSVDSLEQETDEFINASDITKLCLFHTHKKLRFIVNSQKSSPQEMANELRMATQVAYTTVRPLKSKEYSENYARRAMTNMVSRIQHAYTHYEGKIRLVAVKDGFENTHVLMPSNFSKDTLDPLYTDDAVKSSLIFSEDSMIDYLDSKRYRI